MGTLPFALQLYTVRDHLEKDFAGTARQVKEMGYDYVELAGYGSLSQTEAKAALYEAGLTPVSLHVGVPDLEGDAQAAIDAVEMFGVSYAVVSAGGETADDWRRVAAALDNGGAKLEPHGAEVCYHNHAHEFVKIPELGDGYVFDFLMESTSPEHVKAEIDTYWVKDGGEDIEGVITKYAGRCPLLHIKDMTAGEPHTFAEVGQGIIGWASVFAAGHAAGAEWFIVEQDQCAGDSLDSARISAEFMASQ